MAENYALPSMVQLRELPLRVELTAETLSLIRTVVALPQPNSPEQVQEYYQRWDAAVRAALTELDSLLESTTRDRISLDPGALKQKLVAEPRRAAESLLGAIRSRLSSDRAEWQRRLAKQAADVESEHAAILDAISVNFEIVGKSVKCTAADGWRRDYSNWSRGAFQAWSGHIGALVPVKTLEGIRGDMDKLEAQLGKKPAFDLERVQLPPFFGKSSPEKLLETFDAPSKGAVIFETFKNGLNTVAMLAGMVVIPVVGQLMNSAPTQVRAGVMTGMVLPILGVSLVVGTSTRKRLFEEMVAKSKEKFRQKMAQTFRGDLDQFKKDVESACQQYSNGVGELISKSFAPLLEQYFLDLESAAATQLAQLQLAGERLQDRLSAIKQAKSQLSSGLKIDLARKLSEAAQTRG